MFDMTHNDLRRWHVEMGFSYQSGAAALGMSRSGYSHLLLGKGAIDLRTALACAAIKAGLPPYASSQARNN